MPLLNQRLMDEGFETSVEAIRKTLASLSQDGRGFAGTQGSIELRYAARDAYSIKLNRNWTNIGALAEKRRRIAQLALETILGKVPADSPPSGDILVSFSFEELAEAVDKDLFLRAEIKDREAALERALMYLHEQQVLTLQQGLAVFRSAMTIRFRPDATGARYTNNHYQPLRHHYKERMLQVHVMSEYARRALLNIGEGMQLVLAYFTLRKDEFVRRYFGSDAGLLEHATTAESFQKIVTQIGNRAQIGIVTAPCHENLLVLAGPGSGKTKAVIHRCAYLLRVKRVPPRGILVCCFNRQTAVELKRRLFELVGEDGRGVMVTTYHGLALRLLGRSYSGSSPAPDLQQLIPTAARLLKGESVFTGCEPDEVRERLLAGFQHILVDEYQDIDADQYELISALAGRTLKDPDQRLSILAVGDDDQNIYGFRGANVQFIRRFQEDYEGKVHYLVQNYRSTKNIIDASNRLIAGNKDRMKSGRPIEVNTARMGNAPGGHLEKADAEAGGRVQIIQHSRAHLASSVIAELKRLNKSLGAAWPSTAVLARTHQDLAEVRILVEREGIPVRWWADRQQIPQLHKIREIRRFLEWLGKPSRMRRASDLIVSAAPFFRDKDRNPWAAFLVQMLEAWKEESHDAELPLAEAREFVFACCAEARREVSFGEGVSLCTIHAAKGTEHDHVLLAGSWRVPADDGQAEELRRLLYVGMTRARHTLGIFVPDSEKGTLTEHMTGPEILRRKAASAEASPHPRVEYAMLGLEHMNLGYAGCFPASSPIHQALASLKPGDPVHLDLEQDRILVRDSAGRRVAALSKSARQAWENRLSSVRQARVFAVVRRDSEQDLDSERRSNRLVPEWEVPVIEVILDRSAGGV